MPIPLVTRILVADDHPIVRSGLKKVLDAQPDMEVVAEADDGAEAVKKALAEDVHLAILDVSMPKTTGIQAAQELHKRKPELKLLMLSMYDSEQFLFESLQRRRLGLRAEVGRRHGHRRGGPAHDARPVVPLPLGDLVPRQGLPRARPAEEEQFDVLTPRELQVLKLIAEAHTSKEIAQELVISVKTVERHRQNILDKLGHERPGRADALRDPPRADPAVGAAESGVTARWQPETAAGTVGGRTQREEACR